MKNEKMLHAIGQIDDDMIEDAVIQSGQKKQPFVRTAVFRRAVAIAACFVLIIGLVFSSTRITKALVFLSIPAHCFRPMYRKMNRDSKLVVWIS